MHISLESYPLPLHDKIILIFILLNKYFLKEIISLFLCVNVTHFNYEYYWQKEKLLIKYERDFISFFKFQILK